VTEAEARAALARDDAAVDAEGIASSTKVATGEDAP